MCTCLEAVNGECGLSQEILVAEHVNLINHKAQEGKGRVAHCELECLAGPGGIQTIISWRRYIINKLDRERINKTTVGIHLILNLSLAKVPHNTVMS